MNYADYSDDNNNSEDGHWQNSIGDGGAGGATYADSESTENSNISNQRMQIPEALQEELLKFSIAYLLEEPENIIDFAVVYFKKLQKYPRLSSSNLASASVDESDESVREFVPVAPRYSTRRKSVFAESYDLDNDTDADEDEHAVFPKTDEQRQRLMNSVKNVLLFRSLEMEQMNQILDAMFERRVECNEFIIKQGDDADNFYVIESGSYKVIVNTIHVHTYSNSGIFGELALLYNMPRAATIQAETDGLLWTMDRHTFRRILLKSAFRKRKMYETLLDSVPMLKALQSNERMNLADALVTLRFSQHDRIIKQGDAANGMYFIEEGTVSVKMDQDGAEILVNQLGKGDYFGELALVTHRPRSASVYAQSDVKVAFLETEAFERILGRLKDIMKKRIGNYEQNLKIIARQSL